MISIVDYGMGNLGSICSMLKKIGAQFQLTSDTASIAAATKLILPGVGAFDAGMLSLQRLSLVELLRDKVVRDRTPALGICLGMQLMTTGSEEGREPGLGWIDAETLRFDNSGNPQMKVPHMGWNVVRYAKQSPLVRDLPAESRFYFVHSYFVRCRHAEDVLLRASHGCEFDAAFQRGNIVGVQFHPEKSHRFGMALLKNFADRM